MGSAANTVSSYPFFAGREGRSPSVPISLEVDRLTRTHILNKDIARHKALIDSASSVQTHRKPSVNFRKMVWALNGIAELGVLTNQTSIAALRISLNLHIGASLFGP
jgi:hypothetical protein